MADHTGDLDQALGALTLAGQGGMPSVGTLAATLGALTLTGAGTSPAVGDLAATLGALTLVAQGGMPSVGTGTPGLLGALTVSASKGSVGSSTTVYYFHPRLRRHRKLSY